ncbi:hypothetical protein EUX98_g3135 [Antrodiella citrinella]|uniref:Uncharacterized protein n=1 Tax=Antrodiella citrinella TaxID=2447956 RepID=A0A4S4MXA3_9APHY|nr:hypothetical protein EUX98_g3135 [Antrodiella citrinella]
MTAAPSPLSQSEPYPPGSSSSPPQTPARHTTNTTRARAEYSNLTDLDVLASRLDEGTSRDGGHYDDLLRLAEFVGPARPAAPSPLEALAAPFVGRVEMQRRRVLRDGRVKLKLALLGTVVDRCGIFVRKLVMNIVHDGG